MSSQQIAVPQQCPDREGDMIMHIPRGSHVHPHCCQAVLAHTKAVTCGTGMQAHTVLPGVAVLKEGPIPVRLFGGAVPIAQLGTAVLGSP